jgi:hypothetical protein
MHVPGLVAKNELQIHKRNPSTLGHPVLTLHFGYGRQFRLTDTLKVRKVVLDDLPSQRRLNFMISMA